MADPLSIIGGLSAGMHLVSASAEALLATIKLVKALREVPDRLALLLNEVDDSITRLSYSCNVGSRTFRNLDPSQLDRLSRTTTALYPALQEVHGLLTPLIPKSDHGGGGKIDRLWKGLLALKVDNELSAKLERLERLNTELIRELGVVGLEVQVTTRGLVMENNATSLHGFAKIEAKMDSLRHDFQSFTVSMNQAHAITVEKPNNAIMNSLKGSPPSELVDCRTSSNDQIYGQGISVLGSKLCVSDPGEEGSTSMERIQRMRQYLSVSSAAVSQLQLNRVPRNSKSTGAGLESILFNIRDYYTNLEMGQDIRRPQFWIDTSLAIYLMKVSAGASRGVSQSQARGFRVLRNSTANASKLLNQATPTIIIELLSTLAPINTATCTYVRIGVLHYLSELAQEQLPTRHPIALVINMLKEDNHDMTVSLRALTFIAERLRLVLGPAHELTLRATKSLCALLRRSGEYAEALRVAGDGVRAIGALLGPGSLHERVMARQLEHVYMDKLDWPAALSVCFEIVRQQQLDSPGRPDPGLHDECAVYTMEDISKICESAGNMDRAIAWLKQARISGGMVWPGRPEPLRHIEDKLVELLKLQGNVDDLSVWSDLISA